MCNNAHWNFFFFSTYFFIYMLMPQKIKGNKSNAQNGESECAYTINIKVNDK